MRKYLFSTFLVAFLLTLTFGADFINATDIPITKDPNITLPLNPPSDAVSAAVYEDDYSAQKIDFNFKHIGSVNTKYTNSDVVCSNRTSMAIINEPITYPTDYKTYIYNSDKDEFNVISDLNDHRVTDCQIVDNKIYTISHKIEIINNKQESKFYLSSISPSENLTTLQTWENWNDGCSSCGPVDIFIDGDTTYIIASYPGTVIKLDKNLNEVYQKEVPEFKWTYNQEADQARHMWKSQDGKYWISSDLALWDFDGSNFGNEYLRDGNYDLDQGLGYYSNRFVGYNDGKNDLFLNEYTGDLYNYKNGVFTSIDVSSHVNNVHYNGKESLLAVSPYSIGGSRSKVFYSYNPKDNKSYNLSTAFSRFDVNFNKGFKIQYNLLLADSKVYRIQFGKNLDEAKEFTVSSNEGVKTINVDYYNRMGYFIGSEQFEYELQNPQIPQFKKFKFHKPEGCDQKPYFEWMLENDRDMVKLEIVINGTDRFEITDLEDKKFELEKYFPGTNSAYLEATTEDGNVYKSKDLEFSLPDSFSSLTHINEEEYVEEYDEEGNLLPYEVTVNIFSLAGSIDSKCDIEIHFLDEEYYFEAKEEGNTWEWEGIELPNREYNVSVIGKCWGYQSEESLTIVVNGDEDVEEPDWDSIAFKTPQTGEEKVEQDSSDTTEDTKDNSKVLIIVAVVLLSLTLGGVVIAVKYKEKILTLWKKLFKNIGKSDSTVQ